jgi:uncharacterized protein with PQ loop repeat
MCDVSNLSNILVFITFLISFALFKIYSISINRIPIEKQRRMKKAEKYLIKYQKENEEFFLQNDIIEN